ncbi:MAG: PfaD family polyunsaturated fatty acid/polyketide biosynthesis protein [Planctomycetaceae bacterium]|nr:PfaD family polyunsaturated fatty acid/polyketide biosynthesis protein [Planctomycetaceae bacterium]
MKTSAPPAAGQGRWSASDVAWLNDPESSRRLLGELAAPLVVVQSKGKTGLGIGGHPDESGLAISGWVPACTPGQLGDRHFRDIHGLRYAYVSGGMATGIASVEIVVEMSKAGMLGIFGAAGVPLPRVEQAIDAIQRQLGDRPYGFNYIHSPAEPGRERAVTDLYLARGIHLAEASAFLDLTYEIVRYRTAGIHRAADGSVVTPNRVMAKVSRVEVAEKFFAPPPERFVSQLVAEGDLTPEQAKLTELIPMAEDVTVEADSGGHTDNRPLVTLLPTMLSLRDRIQAKYQFARAPRVGAAGGVATPMGVLGAFSLGAAYVMTGSIQQACVESGTSPVVRQMLAEAGQADCIMCPAADMFEMGVKVQVLKRGTMFAMRASKLYELYRTCESIEAIPEKERVSLEKTVFQRSLDDVWAQTVSFFQERDPKQLEKANRDPKHRMALVFRWYLGQASRWATSGDPARRLDYQIWCGPAMGAFNEWTKGTFLEKAEERKVAVVARNLMYGAAYGRRYQMLSLLADDLPTTLGTTSPLTDAQLAPHFA